MTKTLYLAIAIIFGSVSNVTTQTYELNWEVARTQSHFFKVIYENLEGDLEFSMGQYDEEDFSSPWFNETLEDLFEHSNQYAILNARPDGLLDASIVTVPSKSVTEPPLAFWQSPEVQHGLINRSGKNESFFLAPMQKNLFSLFFQLPEQAVQIGQEWPIDLNMLNASAGIYPELSSKVVKAKLTNVKKKRGDTEASIQYEIKEYLEGNYQGQHIIAKAQIIGKAIFLLKAGRWKRFDAVMSIEGTGFMQGSQQIRFALKPIDKVPSEVLQLLEDSK
ncbi:MAG: hypothetical protein F6K19_23975 [Cyanothece sp. SIO1E1]|nr:hypothetical protein [Cyanothece sp. SIO1E1]